MSIETLNAIASNPTISTYVTVGILGLLPMLFIAMTCFARVIIVFAMLRHGLGLQQSPPNIVLVILSMVVTLFVMQPVFQSIESTAVVPYSEGKLTLPEAASAAIIPLRAFMAAQIRTQELDAVIQIAGGKPPKSLDETPITTLTTAFLLNELRVAFQMGFFLLLPFLLVDLVVSSVLMGLGMIMVPPQSISLPLKLLIFLLVDGWILLTHSIVGSVHVATG
jgi:flagellar biosynthesis protein FliP